MTTRQYWFAKFGVRLEPAREALTTKDKQDGNEDIAAPKQQDNT